MIEINGVKLGNVFTASGARGWYGEGYWHHKFFKWLLPGFDFTGSTFIAKTVTMQERMPKMNERGGKVGNLPLNRQTLQPIESFPSCIKVSLFKGEVLNAVGLTGLKALDVFQRGGWQQIKEPFVISFMALGNTQEERQQETLDFCNIFRRYLSSFSVPIALQINISCPNTQHDVEDLSNDAIGQLDAAKILDIPVGLKINALTPIDAVKYFADTDLCDFLEIPNTLPYGKRPDKVNWVKKFGKRSPLEKYGGGGYSGPENFQLALEWIKQARKAGITIPIICGGIASQRDVYKAYSAGADAVAFARITMSPFHAWKIKGIIKYANELFSDWRE